MKKTVGDTYFASLIVDGATDLEIQEQDIVFVLVFVAGKVAVRFLSIEKTPKTDAVGVTASIVRAVEVSLDTMMTIFNKKFVSIATDGASVRSEGGCRGPSARKPASSPWRALLGTSGVVALLRESQPAHLGVYCFAHRLQLACRDVISKHPAYGELDRLLRELCSNFVGIKYKKNYFLKQYPPNAAGAMLKFCWD